MSARDHATSPDPAITQIETATRALKMAALEADVEYPADRIALLRSLLQLLQSSRDLAEVVTRHAATEITDGGRPEQQHHRHLDVMAYHLRLARGALIASCVPIVQQQDRDAPGR